MLDRLSEAIGVAHSIQPDGAIVERLAALAEAHPVMVVECLGHLLEGAQDDYWNLDLWVKHAREALAIAVKNPESRSAALDVVNRFGARGYIAFRDLTE